MGRSDSTSATAGNGVPILAAVAFAASALPAIRAAGADPVAALRAD